MAEVDLRLIDPSEKQLAAALRRAHAAANRTVRGENPKLEREASFWDRFARDCLREREGRRRSCRAGSQTPEVITGWWTDPAGRRHVRVIGRTRQRWVRLRGEVELRGLPPWWQVYPEAVLAVRGATGGETFLASCRCGAVGSPESLGWMGDTCGPCFDRRADGGVPSGGFGHFPGWAGWHSRVGFSPDGTRLIGLSVGNKFRSVDRADGSEVVGRGTPGTVAALAAGPDGVTLAFADGRVVRWAGGDRPPVTLLNRPRTFGRVALAPDARRVVVLNAVVGFTADLTAAAPRYERVGAPQHYTVARFTPAGDRLLGLSPAGELSALDPATLAPTLLKANVFDGLTRYGYPHDLAVAADGTAVAFVRQTHYPPAHAVRVVPLRDGPTTDLRLPPWHAPTALAFAPDGSHLATADTQSGWVGFWRLPGGRLVGFVRAVPENPGWRGGQVVFAPDGRAVAVLCIGVDHDRESRGSTVVVWPWPDVAAAAGP